MSAEVVAKVRRSSLVSTFGVGSLLPSEDDSFMIRGLDDWPKGDVISEPRLAASLEVSEFRSPASWRGKKGDVPAVRFPEWSFCTGCRRLGPWWTIVDRDSRLCAVCNDPVSPSRFVVCCLGGHIDDFPYRAWVHQDGSIKAEGHDLRLISKGHTSALSDLLIKCSCGKERSMAGAFDFGALRGIRGCFGSRPWLDSNDTDCKQEIRTLQRGSSNVWFAVTRSAISIPSVTNLADAHVAQKFSDVSPEFSAEQLAGMLPVPAGLSKEDIRRAIERMRNPAVSDAIPSERDLRAEEYSALVQGSAALDDDALFLCEEVDLVDSGVPELISQVSRVGRLREVRALTGFSRVVPATEENDAQVAPLVEKGKPHWLPAVEVLGEGVFLRIDSELLETWAEGAFARERSRLLHRSQDMSSPGSFAGLVDVTPKSLVLHSLAHVLVDEMSLTSGYPTASLRERVYDDEGQAGILIYTATADSAGSLGGLAALSDKHRLAATLASGIQRARWCTSDPVCSESTGAGVNGMNLAACHACLLVPETSCERFNVGLDRACLVGLPQSPHDGLFESLFI